MGDVELVSAKSTQGVQHSDLGGAGGSQQSQEGSTSGPVCHSRPDAGGSASHLMSDPHQAAREGEGEVDTTPTSHQSISSQRAALGQWHLQPLGT